MIECKDLSLRRGDFRLDKISFSAGNGEYIVLLGPSGAGKTMLLETIAGIRLPDTGCVTINGKDMAGIPPERRGTALVYQDYSLFPHLTVAENIAYAPVVQGKGARGVQEKVRSHLVRFGIPSLADRYPLTLSGGEQQRVAIARALAANPSVLLLDEPFASLDPRTREDCIEGMRELKETRSVTILQVSHSVEDAYALADRVVVLIGGKVAQIGTPDMIFHDPVSPEVARFTGLENILTGTIVNQEASQSSLLVGSAKIHLPVRFPGGTRVTAGIPAPAVRVFPEPPSSTDTGTTVLSCTVRQVSVTRDLVQIGLNGTIPLRATLYRSREEGWVMEPGMTVFAVLSAEDIRILDGGKPDG